MVLATNLTVLILLLSFLYLNKKIIFGVLASIYVSIINSTKTHESDLGDYVFYYLRANELSLSEYIAENFIWYSFEPLYLLSSYFFSRSGLPVEIFLFGISVFIYLFFIKAVLNFNLKHKNAFYFSIVLLVFSPIFFSLSLHLIRQLLAYSLCFYLMSKKTKKSYFLIPALIHISAVIIPVALFLHERIGSLKKVKNTIIIAGSLLGFTTITLLISANIPQTSTSFFLQIISKVVSTHTHDLGGLNALQITLIILSNILVFFRSAPSKDYSKINSIVVLLTLIMVFNYSQSELLVRLFVLFYYLLTFQLISLIKAKTNIVVPALIISFIVFRISLAYSTWEYNTQVF